MLKVDLHGASKNEKHPLDLSGLQIIFSKNYANCFVV